eukprot:4371572-Prymnesium_polylepis.1
MVKVPDALENQPPPYGWSRVGNCPAYLLLDRAPRVTSTCGRVPDSMSHVYAKGIFPLSAKVGIPTLRERDNAGRR